MARPLTLLIAIGFLFSACDDETHVPKERPASLAVDSDEDGDKDSDPDELEEIEKDGDTTLEPISDPSQDPDFDSFDPDGGAGDDTDDDADELTEATDDVVQPDVPDAEQAANNPEVTRSFRSLVHQLSKTNAHLPTLLPNEDESFTSQGWGTFSIPSSAEGSNTVPLYRCVVSADARHFLSTDESCTIKDASGTILDTGTKEQTLGHIYTEKVEGSVGLYVCRRLVDGQNRYLFRTHDKLGTGCKGHQDESADINTVHVTTGGAIGYVYPNKQLNIAYMLYKKFDSTAVDPTEDHMLSFDLTESASEGYTVNLHSQLGFLKSNVGIEDEVHTIYRCVDIGNSDHFISTDSTCGEHTMEQVMGYTWKTQQPGTNKIHSCSRVVDGKKNTFATRKHWICNNMPWANDGLDLGFGY